MKFTPTEKKDIIENALSWIVVFAMFAYGIGKYFQFRGAAQVDRNISELTGQEFMWAFYGYTQGFPIVLGVFEVTGGLLLLFKRTRLLGCFFLSTILVNVILQDIFYEVNVGALRAAIIYQLILFIILWMNRDRVIASIQNLILPKPDLSNWQSVIIKLAIAFVIFVVLRYLEWRVTMW